MNAHPTEGLDSKHMDSANRSEPWFRSRRGRRGAPGRYRDSWQLPPSHEAAPAWFRFGIPQSSRRPPEGPPLPPAERLPYSGRHQQIARSWARRQGDRIMGRTAALPRLFAFAMALLLACLTAACWPDSTPAPVSRCATDMFPSY